MRALVFLAIIGWTSAFTVSELFEEEWQAYKLEHKKVYEDAWEDRMRFRLFEENKLRIAEHNELFAIGEVSYELELNLFADMLPEEIAIRNGFNETEYNKFLEDTITFIPPANVNIPSSMDWRNYGAVTGVKDQGRCGSCWAFTTTGVLEGQYFRRTKRLVSLSEQNLIDCSSNYGNHGCQGGWMASAVNYIRDNHGIDTEVSYPYQAVNSVCRFNRHNVGATAYGYVSIPKGNEYSLLLAVATKGPIAVAIDAGQQSFAFYKNGIYNDPNCKRDAINHAVLIVGYGHDANGGDYWLVKNSWGPHWGQAGYIKIARNRNICGIGNYGGYPLV